MSEQNIIFIWDGEINNYVTVCLESLRLYNKQCKIFFFYKYESVKNQYLKFDINFIKIDETAAKNRFQYYKILISKKIMENLNENDKLLVLDCDVLFQNDPFLLFNDRGDLYYTHCIMSTKDSLRPEYLWKSVDYRVNGGVWGIIVNANSKKLIDFWLDNLLNNTWDKWKNYQHHIKHGITNLNWWVDQDFLNCIDNNELPFKIKKIIVGYKFNYFTSTWGYFNDNLEMGSKIGNQDYVIIHFKSDFKDTYNLNKSNIYNLNNILLKKNLTTSKSRIKIYNKFMSRGDKRYVVI